MGEGGGRTQQTTFVQTVELSLYAKLTNDKMTEEARQPLHEP